MAFNAICPIHILSVKSLSQNDMSQIILVGIYEDRTLLPEAGISGKDK